MSTPSPKAERVYASCIMPTFDRRIYVPRAMDCFLMQDFSARELVIVDDGEDRVDDLVPDDPRIHYIRLKGRYPIGAKRNLACEHAKGDVIVHWDDDDWSAPFRLTYQVAELRRNGGDICGARRLLYWDEERDLAWRYRYPGSEAWFAGNTLCYTREHWSRVRFRSLQVGEDAAFVRDSSGARLVELQRDDFLVARVHDTNVSPKRIERPAWIPCPSTTVHEILDPAREVHAR